MQYPILVLVCQFSAQVNQPVTICNSDKTKAYLSILSAFLTQESSKQNYQGGNCELITSPGNCNS